MTVDAINSYCARAASFWHDTGFETVGWFLLSALALALVSGALAAYEKIVMLKKVGEADNTQLRELVGSPETGVLQAVAGVIDSLVKAPTWFALFLAAATLTWIGSAAMSEACKPPVAVDGEATGEDGRKDPLDEPAALIRGSTPVRRAG